MKREKTKYNFDKIINRQGSNAMGVDGFRDYLFDENDQLNFPCEDHEFISMWVADMEFATSPDILNAIKKRVDHGILGYSKIFDTKYKESFIQWTKSKYGYAFNKEHIVASQGVLPALYDLIEYLCEPGEKALTMTPSYAFFKHAMDYNSRELVITDLICNDGEYDMDLEDIRKKTSDEKVTLCIFCNPHNPTGRLWTEAELKELGKICFENNVVIISDEIHCDLLRKGRVFTPLEKLFPESDYIVTCMAPSKTFNLAGIMLANIVIPNDNLRDKWNEKHPFFENPLSIAAAQAAYTHGKGWLNELTDYLDDNFEFLCDYLEKHLPKAKFRIPDSTYLAWINVGAYFPKNQNLTLFFANNSGVLLEGGHMFVSNANGYIRLNVACPRSRLEEGLSRISKAIMTMGERKIGHS